MRGVALPAAVLALPPAALRQRHPDRATSASPPFSKRGEVCAHVCALHCVARLCLCLCLASCVLRLVSTSMYVSASASTSLRELMPCQKGADADADKDTPLTPDWIWTCRCRRGAEDAHDHDHDHDDDEDKGGRGGGAEPRPRPHRVQTATRSGSGRTATAAFACVRSCVPPRPCDSRGFHAPASTHAPTRARLCAMTPRDDARTGLRRVLSRPMRSLQSRPAFAAPSPPAQPTRGRRRAPTKASARVGRAERAVPLLGPRSRGGKDIYGIWCARAAPASRVGVSLARATTLAGWPCGFPSSAPSC